MKQKWILPTVIICILLVAAACLYTLLGIKEETPLIGSWNTDQSILGYAPISDLPDEVTVSFFHENEGQEWRAINNPSQQADAKTVPFYYEVSDGKLTVWQGTLMNTYQYSITKQENKEILTLKKDDDSTILLERLSDRPAGIQR